MRTPTIKEVAARSGVGVGTVSRVLNNSPQISEETRKEHKKVKKDENIKENNEAYYKFEMPLLLGKAEATIEYKIPYKGRKNSASAIEIFKV